MSEHTFGHTRGPWLIYSREPSGYKVHSEGLSVAWCPTATVSGQGGTRSVSLKDAKANARLIAAAPEMLEVLELVNQSGRSGQWEKVETWLPLVRTVIAKATGLEAPDAN